MNTVLTLNAPVVAALIALVTASPSDAQSPMTLATGAILATYCENNACEPVTLQISGGDSFIINRWGDHREAIRIANIDAPNPRARCSGERGSAERAIGRLGQLLAGSTFTIARIAKDHRGVSIAFASIDRRDVGHQLTREHLVWPKEPRHRSWC